MHPSEMNFTVHPSSGVPLYRQIMEQVIAMVASGRVESGDMLPSIRDLAQSLEVNMMTVSKAYSKLESDGVLKRLRGRGMVFADTIATKSSVKDRQSDLQPVVEQAVLRGLQLGLTQRQILAVVQSVLKEKAPK
ncbi:GntR family transcriptional regulator [Mariniblastus sp.]|nr:GntR family transcriptional regulator [Mariniblastus sp.]